MEEAEDKILEEEEFDILREEQEEEELMSFGRQLAKKADALDAELRRIHYCLFERQQLLVDRMPATITGRPTSIHRVRQHLQQQTAKSEVGETGSEKSTKAATAEKDDAALQQSCYANWHGTSSPILRGAGWLGGRLHRQSRTATAKELVTLHADLDYIRRVRALHQLNYYSRLNLIPKRHIIHALYQVAWNMVVALQNACGCVFYGILRDVQRRGWIAGAIHGGLHGTAKALLFLLYGYIVSPMIHLTRGLWNSMYGPLNALYGRYMFDAMSGRWMVCSVAETRLFAAALQREKRLLRAIGRTEFARKKMKAETKWAARLASMGFSVEMMKNRLHPTHDKNQQSSSGSGGDADIQNPYEVLKVRRQATLQEIKTQYKKLAKVFHPDVVQSHHGGPLSAEERAAAQRRFEEVASAYQLLSNGEKRRAYDLGGAQGVRLHESKYGTFMTRTPAEMVQSIFGGEPFRRRLTGELLRSHWALRYEAQVSVSLHELEELQCIRVRQLAMELAVMADVHAKGPAGLAATDVAKRRGRAARTSSDSYPCRTGVATSSSLPDYLGQKQRPPPSARAPGGNELHGSIMEELGERKSTLPTASAAIRRRPERDGQQGLASASPYILQPGSNDMNCFSRDFIERVDRFVQRLSTACFGQQLLYEVGEAYVVAAQRFLQVRPFYAPKLLVTRRIFSGMDRVLDAFMDNKKISRDEIGQKMMAEYFSMEYDAVVADLHVALRYATQIVLQDADETEEVRQKRCYAVWWLGQTMMEKGSRWNSRLATDEDFVAYLQQAATSASTTGKPPAF